VKQVEEGEERKQDRKGTQQTKMDVSTWERPVASRQDWASVKFKARVFSWLKSFGAELNLRRDISLFSLYSEKKIDLHENDDTPGQNERNSESNILS
jgi:hypothetical protein